MKNKRDPAQISLTEERIVDSFSGGGGASSGIELATGRVVDVAINHDKDAILMHSVNHPFTKHLQASVWDVEPEDAVDGAPVGLLWASPDCKHFSKAKGAPLVDRNIRGLSWIVVKWCLRAPPRVFIMENVEEIQTWGPLMPMMDQKTGRPMKKVGLASYTSVTGKIVDAVTKLVDGKDYKRLAGAIYDCFCDDKQEVFAACMNVVGSVPYFDTDSEHNTKLTLLYRWLESLGYEPCEEEKQMIDGSHELYHKGGK